MSAGRKFAAQGSVRSCRGLRGQKRKLCAFEVYGSKSNKLLDLVPTALYELAAPSTPEEVREEIERRVAASVTHR